MVLDINDVVDRVSSLAIGTPLKKNDKIGKIEQSITQSASIIFKRFVWPIMIFIIIFLGAISTMYPHESTFEQDTSNSICSLGEVVYKIYDIGAQNTNWVYYFLILLVGSAWFTWGEVSNNIKRIWRSGDGMSAQEVIDKINMEMKMKGNKYIK